MIDNIREFDFLLDFIILFFVPFIIVRLLYAFKDYFSIVYFIHQIFEKQSSQF